MAKRAEKTMSIEVASQLSRIERLDAYLSNGYKVLEEDADYYELVQQAFRIVYNCESIDEARSRLLAIMPDANNIAELLDDVKVLFHDLFEINKDVMRMMLEKQFRYIYERSIQLDEMGPAVKALKNIADLYRLYDKNSSIPNLPSVLPETRLSSDPEVFVDQKNYLDAAKTE